MNKWIWRLLLLFQIGGGLFGLWIVAHVLLQTEQTTISACVNLAFAVVFVFGIAAGAALIKRPKLGLWLSLIYQFIQIPIITTSVVAYRMFSGATFHIYFGQSGFGTYLYFGSRYFFWLNSNQPWLVGVNFVALFFFIYLVWQLMLEAAAVKDVEVSAPACESTGAERHISWRTS